jgi:hypothetical protein
VFVVADGEDTADPPEAPVGDLRGLFLGEAVFRWDAGAVFGVDQAGNL